MPQRKADAIEELEIHFTISAEDYNALRRSAGWDPVPEKKAQIGLDNAAFLVAAVFAGDPIGMARVISDGGYVACIADVMVCPGCQGQGIGSTLMELVMDYIDATLGDGDFAMVSLMAAKGNEDFYNKFGFTLRDGDAESFGMSRWILK